MSDEPKAPAEFAPPVSGPILAGGLVVSAAAMLAAASLGWIGIPILLAFLAVGAALLVRWSL